LSSPTPSSFPSPRSRRATGLHGFAAGKVKVPIGEICWGGAGSIIIPGFKVEGPWWGSPPALSWMTIYLLRIYQVLRSIACSSLKLHPI